MEHRKGEVVEALVRAVAEGARDHDADVALVLPTAEAFAAAQQARHRLGAIAWAGLDDRLVASAARLGALARAGKLVLFIGAGAGHGAGLPSWKRLLKSLAEEAGMSKDERKALKRLDARDAGRILQQRLGERFRAAIVELVDAPHVGLQHQLLASLPVTEAVTTNYDALFERAWAATGVHPRVLPRDAAADATRWLLKLHGSIDAQDEIVLSRDDYLRFDTDRAALAGLVQAMLLTRHMLFVGYSMQDDNFHRLAHQVRSVLGNNGDRMRSGVFGTTITPDPPGLRHELWQDDVHVLSTAGDGDPFQRVDILLDRVVAEASGAAAHLLDDSYDALFSEDERRIGAALRDLEHALDDDRLSDGVRMAIGAALDAVRLRPTPDEPSAPLDLAGIAAKGSQRHLQLYVNRRTEALESALATALPDLRNATFEWCSPLMSDLYREYHDTAFLDVVGLGRLTVELKAWWPSGGPRWDGLAIIHRPHAAPAVLLLEAKAHVAELESTLKASTERSRRMILAALESARTRLGADGDGAAWTVGAYQHANRLAHAMFLRDHGIDAYLVHVLFTDDRGHRATDAETWERAWSGELDRLGLGLPPEWATAVLLPAVEETG